MNWKLSTKILASIFIFMIVNVILTAYILRAKAAKEDLTQKYRHKNEVRQPFKHLVFIQKFDSLVNPYDIGAIGGEVVFVEGNVASAVTHANNKNSGVLVSYRLVSDTLFVELSRQNSGVYSDFEMDICAPNLATIQTHFVDLTLSSIKTTDLQLQSWGLGKIILVNQKSNLTNIFATMHEKTALNIDTSFHVLQKVDVNLHEQAKLFLPNVTIEKFTFKGEAQTQIEAPSKFFK